MKKPESESTPAQSLHFKNGRSAKAITAPLNTEITPLLETLGLDKQAKALISISGGADGLEAEKSSRLQQLFSRGIAVAAAETGADLIDGGTDSGVMAMMGQGVADRNYRSRLIGVIPAPLVDLSENSLDVAKLPAEEGALEAPSTPAQSSASAKLESNHSHFVLADAPDWGEEIPLKNRIIEKMAQHIPTLSILVNGGDLSRTEILHSVRMGWPVIVISGSGRLADEITELKNNPPDFIEDTELAEIMAEGRLYLFSLDDVLDKKIAELQRLIRRLLRGDTTLKQAWERFARYDFNATRQQRTFHRVQMTIIVLSVLGTAMALLQGTLDRELALINTYRLNLYQNGMLAQYNEPPKSIIAVYQQHEKLRQELKDKGIEPDETSLLTQLPADNQAPVESIPEHIELVENLRDFRILERISHWVKNHFIYFEAIFRFISNTLQNLIILVPIIVTALLAAANRFNNGNKWLALRSSAEAVKREIFRYRAQAEIYFPVAGEKKNQEIKLDDRLKLISDQLMQSEVNLSALHPSPNNIPPRNSIAEADDGYSPLSPEQYLSYRLENQLNYYVGKTVKLEKKLYRLQIWIYIFGGIGTLLAAVGLELWIALTSSLVAALGTYLSYQQIETTLLKYNKAASELDNIRSWWTALPSAEQEKQANINLMVGQSERTLHSEFSGWVQEMQDTLLALKEEQQEQLAEHENLETAKPETTLTAQVPGASH
ncbi:SLATT domain-containing protein [Candidatus Venteria ishoeyi]|uniref:SLATT domain-containing protein n=1 Tax=Candidatus Venteria ishoeyi TaxID=1899563 RepID=UPI0025A55F29|nr:SLATT domain-containing protein [Candidatus Venteria ishoeyi]MDM8547474.1 SLATT domain-containing protein [Candidatus Venteria ishoeyi]